MERIEAPYGAWDPASVTQVAALFAPLRELWWIAGGYAVELAVGRAFRGHADIDVLLLREDQLAAQRALAGWEWWAADPPGTLRPWAAGEILPAGVHDIWCRPGSGALWRVQLMLDEAQDGHWVSRRDPRVRRPLDTLGATTAEGVPFLAPEVQLHYKAKARRPKDEEDFTAALPVLTAGQRRWLAKTIAQTYGPHPWTERLRG
ncbi:nucleotidyltransferase domain-containing protein [Streptomyces albidoflavus]|uniref:nucleotidyltransferase domain-containing protein n=1 Tax=Streptomyces albidoflavus TaxID=1886 RepID=UPI00188AAD6C|nr:amino acid transporter [Streptomyces albidoflavus]MBF4137736.1 amino acid transporter [Streptomyces albidoflavus]